METLYASVKKLLEKKLKFDEFPDWETFVLSWSLNRCEEILLNLSVQGSESITMFAEYNEKIPPDKLPIILELSARVNDCLRFTRMKVDFNDNHLGVHASNLIPSNIDSKNLEVILYGLIRLVLRTMNDCHTSVMKILYGDVTAESAFQIWANESGYDKQALEDCHR